MSESSDQTIQVLAQADALMRRHRVFIAGSDPGRIADTEPAADDDVPVLTEVVTPAIVNGLASTDPLAELIGRQEAVTRNAIEQWLDERLPAEVLRLTDELSDRMVNALRQQVRDELLPVLLASLTAAKQDGPGQG